jgi:molybdate transport system ATP-binding protein
MNTGSIHASFSLRYPAAQRSGFTLDVALELPARGITGIFGHSGSGKTTLLRCIAGLQHADHGRLKVKDEIWQDESILLPSHKRPVGYVFQEHSLFPHLTARGNLAYALKRASPAAHANQFDHIIDLLGIEPLLRRYPQQLSGGECQRVAIARALLVNPRLLLMDEPLSSLDLARKQEILPYLENVRNNLAIPVLYVSHSADEIARLADHLVVLDQGKAVANGPLSEVLNRLDLPIRLHEEAGAVLQATVTERDSEWHLLRVAFPGGELWVRDSGEAIGTAVRIRILARDISLALQPHADTSILNRLPGKISAIAPDSEATNLVSVDVGESTLIARITRRSTAQLGLAIGSSVWAQIKSAAIVR